MTANKHTYKKGDEVEYPVGRGWGRAKIGKVDGDTVHLILSSGRSMLRSIHTIRKAGPPKSKKEKKPRVKKAKSEVATETKADAEVGFSAGQAEKQTQESPQPQEEPKKENEDRTAGEQRPDRTDGARQANEGGNPTAGLSQGQTTDGQGAGSGSGPNERGGENSPHVPEGG